MIPVIPPKTAAPSLASPFLRRQPGDFDFPSSPLTLLASLFAYQSLTPEPLSSRWRNLLLAFTEAGVYPCLLCWRCRSPRCAHHFLASLAKGWRGGESPTPPSPIAHRPSTIPFVNAPRPHR